MRKRSYAELEAERQRLAKAADLAQAALTATFRGKPDASEIARVSGHKWAFRLYNSTYPCGGLVVEVYTVKGQRPYVAAHYLDDLHANLYYYDTSEEASARRSAIQRLWDERNRRVSAPPQE